MPTTPETETTHAAVQAEVEIAAAPERVFDALTDPRELAEWWASDDTHRAREWRTDPREGGAWSARTLDADGREGTLGGAYVVVDRPHHLAYTWHTSDDTAAPTLVDIELAPADVDGVAGTRVTVTHTTLGDERGITCCAAAAACATTDRRWARALRRFASGRTTWNVLAVSDAAAR